MWLRCLQQPHRTRGTCSAEHALEYGPLGSHFLASRRSSQCGKYYLLVNTPFIPYPLPVHPMSSEIGVGLTQDFIGIHPERYGTSGNSALLPLDIQTDDGY